MTRGLVSLLGVALTGITLGSSAIAQSADTEARIVPVSASTADTVTVSYEFDGGEFQCTYTPGQSRRFDGVVNDFVRYTNGEGLTGTNGQLRDSIEGRLQRSFGRNEITTSNWSCAAHIANYLDRPGLMRIIQDRYGTPADLNLPDTEIAY